MNLSKVTFSKSGVYRTGSILEPINFFVDTLPQANQFDFLLGYFSSSAIYTLSCSFAKFIYNGGKVRLIINNILSSNDKKILQGEFNNQEFSLGDFKSLNNALNEYDKHFFECIAWLIKQKRIEIIVIKPSNKNGISHYKSGIIGDGVNKVKFKSSCNFTATALLENLEELDIKKSWIESDVYAIEEQQQYFDDIFYKRVDFVEYLEVTKIKEAIFEKFGNKDILQLIEDEQKIIQQKKLHIDKNQTLKNSFENLENELYKIINEPKFPYSAGARDYQKKAYENWINNDKKGIFAMATGTGKTLTSLNCLLQEYKKEGFYQAIILVPTIALLNQWKEECTKFNFQNIITISSKEKWEKKIRIFNMLSKISNPNFIIIVTYVSFTKNKFQTYFKSISNRTLLIADEVHNMGANSFSKILKNVHLIKRIGLSATPNRIYDEEGNSNIDNFFNDQSPYIYNFGMKEAISKGYLCRYYYYPHIVNLTSEELKEYIEISQQLVKYIDSKTGRYKKIKKVEILLLERKRIIHKAQNKIFSFRLIVKKELENRRSKGRKLDYTLVYTPEGIVKTNSLTDLYEEDNEDILLIDQFTDEIKNIDSNISVSQYTSKTKYREEAIRKYTNGEIHVLTSMKCLDEGVDIPRSELAIFCSSTGNPRQFIQRRGRVLRVSKGKFIATIHDLVVVPKIDNTNTLSFNMERSLLINELKRVVSFSKLSENKTHTLDIFEGICEIYNINLYEIENDLEE